MTDADLIRRLRNWPSCYSHDSWVRTICTEAADALEERGAQELRLLDRALLAEKRLEQSGREGHEAYKAACARALAAESERDRLREALERLIERADVSDDCRYGTLSAEFVREIAHAALRAPDAQTCGRRDSEWMPCNCGPYECQERDALTRAPDEGEVKS